MSLSPRPSGPVAISGEPVGEPGEESRLGLPEEERYLDGALLGRGGIGEVRAVRDRRLERDVARKVLLVEDASGEARLAREARITAQLEHPGIVPVYDAGRTEDGRGWYTMRVIRGRDLAIALAETPDPIGRSALLRHFLDACEAVGFAHSNRVIHRDLKPANILVGEFGETQVADWGLARELDSDERDHDLVGTPHYMSPEQARGEPATPRSDVWALGAILFEILSGQPLWRGAAPAVIQRLLTEAPPRVRSVRPDAPAELAAIAERALALDPQERYATAHDLARDLARWFDGRRVSAYEYSALDLLKRTLKAWRLPLAFAASAGGLGLVLAGVAWTQTARERDKAQAAESATLAALDVADRNLAWLSLDRAREALDRDDRPTSERLAADVLANGPSAEALGVLAAWGASPRPRVVSRLALGPCDALYVDDTGDVLICTGPDGIRLTRGDQASTLQGSPAGIAWTGSAVVYTQRMGDTLWISRDGAELGRAAGTALPEVVPIPGGDQVVLMGNGRLFIGSPSGELVEHRMCGDGAPVAVAADLGRVYTACDDGSLYGGPPENPSAKRLCGDSSLRAASLTVHGGYAILGTLNGEVVRIDPDGVIVDRVRHGDLPIRDAAVAPSGERAVVTGARGSSALVDLHTGAVLTTFPGSATLARWRDEHTVLRFGDERVVWDIPAGVRPVRLPGPEGVSAVDLSHGHAAVAHGDGTLLLWDLGEGRPLPPIQWQLGVIKGVALSPDGRHFLATGVQSTELIWGDTQSGLTLGLVHARRLRRLVWPATGPVGLPYSTDPFVRWPAIRDGAEAIPFGSAFWTDLDASPSGVLAAIDRAGQVVRVDPDGTLHPLMTEPRATSMVAVSDQDVAIGLPDEVLVVALDGSRLRRVTGCGQPAEIALSDDGTRLAIGAMDGHLTVWDTADPRAPLLSLRAHQEQISAIAFGPDDLLLTGSWDRTARLWDLSVLSRDPTALANEITAAWGRASPR